MKGSALLDAYLTRRFAVALVLSVLGLVLVATIIDLIENIDTYIDYRVDRTAILLCYLYRIPYWVILTLPISGLLGTLFALTGLARHNEIAAMEALGIGLHRILLPVLLVAAVVSATAFLFTDRIVPAATYRYNQIHNQITARERPDGSRRQVLLQDVGGQMLYARVWDAERMQAQDVSCERHESGRLAERLNGRVLDWRDGRWILRHGSAYRVVTDSARGPARADAHADAGADGPPAPAPGDSAPASLALVTQTFDSLELSTLTLLPADLSRLQKQPDEMTYAELRQHIRRAEANGEDVARHRVDLHLKVAFPLTFLIIVALGAPVGANARGAGLANSFGKGIAICFLFYGCVKAGQALGWNQVVRPWAGAWAVNIIFGTLSAVLLWRARK